MRFEFHGDPPAPATYYKALAQSIIDAMCLQASRPDQVTVTVEPLHG